MDGWGVRTGHGCGSLVWARPDELMADCSVPRRLASAEPRASAYAGCRYSRDIGGEAADQSVLLANTFRQRSHGEGLRIAWQLDNLGSDIDATVDASLLAVDDNCVPFGIPARPALRPRQAIGHSVPQQKETWAFPDELPGQPDVEHHPISEQCQMRRVQWRRGATACSQREDDENGKAAMRVPAPPSTIDNAGTANAQLATITLVLTPSHESCSTDINMARGHCPASVPVCDPPVCMP